MKKNISGRARQAILRSLDSAVSSLLALISREYAQLVQRTTVLYTEGAPECYWFSGFRTNEIHPPTQAVSRKMADVRIALTEGVLDFCNGAVL